MNTFKDLCEYVAHSNFSLPYGIGKINERSKLFWNGVLVVLEAEGRISLKEGKEIWNEIIEKENRV